MCAVHKLQILDFEGESLCKLSNGRGAAAETPPPPDIGGRPQTERDGRPHTVGRAEGERLRLPLLGRPCSGELRRGQTAGSLFLCVVRRVLVGRRARVLGEAVVRRLVRRRRSSGRRVMGHRLRSVLGVLRRTRCIIRCVAMRCGGGGPGAVSASVERRVAVLRIMALHCGRRVLAVGRLISVLIAVQRPAHWRIARHFVFLHLLLRRQRRRTIAVAAAMLRAVVRSLGMAADHILCRHRARRPLPRLLRRTTRCGVRMAAVFLRNVERLHPVLGALRSVGCRRRRRRHFMVSIASVIGRRLRVRRVVHVRRRLLRVRRHLLRRTVIRRLRPALGRPVIRRLLRMRSLAVLRRLTLRRVLRTVLRRRSLRRAIGRLMR